MAKRRSDSPAKSSNMGPTQDMPNKSTQSVVFLFVFLIQLVFAALMTGADRPNVLLLCIDDLRPELRSFGARYVVSPNIDRLAQEGRAFHRHYVQAPTCGASRFTMLTGKYGGAGNGALFARAKKLAAKLDDPSVSPSMPAWFRKHGYVTVSVGKVSHHPGGRGGKDWNDNAQPEMPNSWDRHLLPAGQWRHPRGWMHGLANGEIRLNAGKMDVFQATDGPDSIYPDGVSVDEAVKQLGMLSEDSDQPFFLAVGVLRPHLPFGAPARYMKPYLDAELPSTPHPDKPTGKTTWHGSGEFMKYNRWQKNPNSDPEFAMQVRKHYAACVSYADAQVGRILAKLDSTDTAKNTIVVLWGDHGWHLGEHAVWGKHTLFEESLRSPLIIKSPAVASRGVHSDAIVETLDLFPTLVELAGIPRPDFVDGVSLKPILDSAAAQRRSSTAGSYAISYSGNAKTIRSDRYRMTLHKNGHVELYDHASVEKETLNIAEDNPRVVQQMTTVLNERLNRKKQP